MHEYSRVLAFHRLSIHLVPVQSLFPIQNPAHQGHPDIRCTLRPHPSRPSPILCQAGWCIHFPLQSALPLPPVPGQETAPWGAGRKSGCPICGAGHHQEIAHVIPCIAHVCKAQPFEATELLIQRQKVRQHLGGMNWSVPVPYSTMLSTIPHWVISLYSMPSYIHPRTLAVSAILSFSPISLPGSQVSHYAQVPSTQPQSATGAGGCLSNKRTDVPVIQVFVGNAVPLHVLKLVLIRSAMTDLLRRVVQ